MRKRVGRRLRRIAAAAAAVWVGLAGLWAGAENMPLGFSRAKLSMVTKPGESSRYMDYYKAGEKKSVSDMPWVEDAERGNAISLSGNNEFLRLTSEPLPLIKSTFTAWVNWEENGDAEPILFTMTSSITPDYMTISLRHTDAGRKIDGLYFHFYHVDDSIVEWFTPVSDGENYAIPPGEWHHIAFTVDGQHFRLYIDGKLWFEQMLIMSFTDLRATRLYIGSAGEKGEKPTLKARLADVCLYDQAMDQNQVLRSMQPGVNPFESGDGTTTETTLYYPTAPSTTAASVESDLSEGLTVIGGLPLAIWLVMGGIVALFVVLSVVLSIRRKGGGPS